MSPSLKQAIRDLAANRCEYCRLPETDLVHVFDHIIARQHGGKTELVNLALCCGGCNRHEGPNISGVDPETGTVVRLFNPRQDRGFDHFRYESAVLLGLSSVGRATVFVLAINEPLRIDARQALIDAGRWF